jgi:hypothetical protein
MYSRSFILFAILIVVSRRATRRLLKRMAVRTVMFGERHSRAIAFASGRKHANLSQMKIRTPKDIAKEMAAKSAIRDLYGEWSDRKTTSASRN